MRCDKKTENVMRDRMLWLKKWLKGRRYEIGYKRKEYLFVYYCTLKALYNDDMAKKMLFNINNSFAKPLQESSVESVIKKCDSRKMYWFKNETIIKSLEITEEEVEELRIGHKAKEEKERNSRMFRNFVQEQEIIKRYNNGETIKEIADSCTYFSKSKIERLLAEPAKERKRIRNQDIHLYHKMGKSYKEIAGACGCDVKTVKKVLRENPSDFLITDKLKENDEQQKFKETGCRGLYSLYKRKTYTSTADSFDQALQQLLDTKDNILIVGAAGTAKSSLVNKYFATLSEEEQKSTLIVAPTGMASQHINGTTIHYAFKLGVGVLIPEEIDSVPKQLLTMNRVIIDEVSMVRIDLFEKVLQIIHYIEIQQHKRIQIILCGDFAQIEPVVSKEDKKVLKKYWPNSKGFHSFDSDLWNDLKLTPIMLTYNFRQTDTEFLEQLDAIKYGSIDALEWFNSKCLKRNYSYNAICICAKNADVDCYNQMMLNDIWFAEYSTFKAIETDVSASDELPCPREITLCVDARVMFIANDKEYKNGNLGTVVEMGKNTITVKLDDERVITVRRKKFVLDSGGQYEQFPVVLGFAITANKAQGCTFPAVVICPGFFAASQLYVALSRCQSLEGLCIMNSLTEDDLVVNVRALEKTII